jgi:hypothetical protein
MSATNSLWGGPCLYTPMHLDALMIGTPNQTKQTWAQVGLQYINLTQAANPAPTPFTGRVNGNPATGVHLHWTLPHGMRRGRQAETADGEVTFPFAPNRWLVTRFVTPPSPAGAAPVATAWVLCSDSLNATTAGESTFPQPGTPSNIVPIGAKFDLSSWTEPGSPTTAFLQAQGPNDLGWAAVYDNVENVFGFYDSLADVQSGSCTYAVMGWYASPSNDPLFGDKGIPFKTQADWQNLMTAHGWALGSASDQEARTTDAISAFAQWIAVSPQTDAPQATPEQLILASQSLCHGMLFGLNWSGANTEYPAPVYTKAGVAPRVAVGSNAAEAVAAYMGQILPQQDGGEDLLLAFQNDLIFKFITDPADYRAACHANRFERSPGGKVWTVAAAGATDGQTPTGLPGVPLDAAQTSALSSLQAAQSAMDAAETSLTSKKWEALSAYVKLQVMQFNPPPPGNSPVPQVQNYLNSLTATTLPQAKSAVTTATKARDSALTALQALLPTQQFNLQQSDDDAFTRPADPVVLLAAIGSDTKLDPPVDLGNDLFTRFTGQTVAGLTVSFGSLSPGTPSVNLLVTDLAPALQGVLQNGAAPGGLPKEAMNLWTENLLLDPTSSAWMAQLAATKAGISLSAADMQTLAGVIATQQTLVWNGTAQVLDQATIAEAAGLLPMFSGQVVHVPSMRAVAKWSPPWTPLYLDWEIAWFPSATTPQGMLSQWQLGEFDFTFTGTGPSSSGTSLSMRSQLTSNYPTSLVAKIQSFLAMDPDLSVFRLRDLQTTVNTLQNTDVMVQSLTGFNEWMLSRVPQGMLPVSNAAVQPWTTGVPNWVPDNSIVDGSVPVFDPLRGGHFRITNLQVVDAFGQVMTGSTGGSVVPIRAASLLPSFSTSDQTIMQIAPRIAQPMQVDLSLLDRDDDTIVTTSADATSPICGWLLPNHLDQSLAVFDDAGQSLGEILRVVTDTGNRLRWDPTPGLNGVLGGPPQIANRHLLNMVKVLLRLGIASTDPLDRLLDLIDVTLWSTDPLGPLHTGNLALLLGRPIAVVRASVGFQLEGDPAYQQDWASTGLCLDDGFPSVPLPLRIGDFKYAGNGSFGYFLDDDYSRCYSMYNYTPKMGAVRRALFTSPSHGLAGLHASMAAADITDMTLNDSYVQPGPVLALPADGSARAMLTVLVDPRGGITAATGTVPVEQVMLPSGPIDSALKAMEANFRMGPLLLNSNDIKVPLPANVQGKWNWIERTGVTFWNEQGPLKSADEKARLPQTPPSLREGWLVLSDALTAKEMPHG